MDSVLEKIYKIGIVPVVKLDDENEVESKREQQKRAAGT